MASSHQLKGVQYQPQPVTIPRYFHLRLKYLSEASSLFLIIKCGCLPDHVSQLRKSMKMLQIASLFWKFKLIYQNRYLYIHIYFSVWSIAYNFTSYWIHGSHSQLNTNAFCTNSFKTNLLSYDNLTPNPNGPKGYKKLQGGVKRMR